MPILYGTEPSFFTRKAWASLRLLGLPVDDRLKTKDVKAEVEAAVNGYHRFPVVKVGEGDWIVDSTVIGVEMSRRHPMQSLLPADPALSALLLLAEDWLDEWFLRACIGWRPVDAETRAWVAERGAKNFIGLPGEAEVPEALAPFVRKAAEVTGQFFISAGRVNGVVPETLTAVRALVDRSLSALDAILTATPYLAGSRPSLADAALWGFLDAGLLWEPKPKVHVQARYPRVVAFHARLRALADAGGQPLGRWDSLETVAARLAPLLATDAMGFEPFQQANRAAMADGTKQLVIDGADCPARGFTEKNRQALGQALRALPEADRARLDAVAGDWPLVHAYLA